MLEQQPGGSEWGKPCWEGRGGQRMYWRKETANTDALRQDFAWWCAPYSWCCWDWVQERKGGKVEEGVSLWALYLWGWFGVFLWRREEPIGGFPEEGRCELEQQFLLRWWDELIERVFFFLFSSFSSSSSFTFFSFLKFSSRLFPLSHFFLSSLPPFLSCQLLFLLLVFKVFPS